MMCYLAGFRPRVIPRGRLSKTKGTLSSVTRTYHAYEEVELHFVQSTHKTKTVPLKVVPLNTVPLKVVPLKTVPLKNCSTENSDHCTSLDTFRRLFNNCSSSSYSRLAPPPSVDSGRRRRRSSELCMISADLLPDILRIYSGFTANLLYVEIWREQAP